MINYDAIRIEYEKMYEDRFSVSRYTETKLLHGETVLGWATVYENIPCRQSQWLPSKNGQTDSVNDINYDVKLFYSPDILLQQGDKCTVTRGTITREYTAGEPFPYPTHNEIRLNREDKA